MHLRMLPDHRNKKYFLTSGVVKKGVLMHFRMITDHQKHGLKKDVFLASGVLKPVF